MMARLLEVVNAAALAALIKDGMRILIVGGRTTNFPNPLRNRKEFEFWQSTDRSWQNAGTVPMDIGTVLFTRFVGHSQIGRISLMAEKMNIPCFGPMRNGHISKVLEATLAVASDKSSTTPEQAEVSITSLQRDFALLPEFILGLVPSEKLTEALLKDEAELGRLLTLCRTQSEYTDITRQRLLRTLRQMLHELGAIEPTAPVDPAELQREETELANTPTEKERVLAQQVETLHRKLGKLTSEYGKLKTRNRVLIKRLEAAELGKRNLSKALQDVDRQVRRLGLRIQIITPK